jgi:hypothetical protein
MGKLAFTHRGRAVILPTVDLLEPLIERTPTHWYWNGEFVEDPFDRCAYFDWAPPFEMNTRWMVPRLLWQLANPTLVAKRVLLENTCGLFTCINPAHWSRRRGAIRIPARIVLPDSVEATPVVHSMEILLVHIRRNDAETTVCGRGSMFKGLVKTTVVTCDACIRTWVYSNQPFTESK